MCKAEVFCPCCFFVYVKWLVFYTSKPGKETALNKIICIQRVLQLGVRRGV